MPIRPPRPRILIASALLCALLVVLFHAPSHPTVQRYLSRPLPTRPSLVESSEADLTWDQGGVDLKSWKGIGIPWLGGSSGTKGHRKILITGGAGQLGRALLPSLIEAHDVHILDIVPRPSTLPTKVTYHRGSLLPSSSALPTLLNREAYDGIIHLGSISLDEWCESKLEECEAVNLGGTRRLMDALKAKEKAPWVVFGSRMADETTLGKMKAQAESIIEDAIESSRAILDSDEARPGLRGTILRFPQVYGYDHLTSIQSTFIPSLISAALTSLPIQYDQSIAPFDLVHVEDAVAGVIAAIHRLEEGQVGLYTVDFDTGRRYTQAELVEKVRRETGTMSPVRTIGQAETARPLEPEGIPTNDLGWAAETSLDEGLKRMVTALNEATHAYSTEYLAQHCSSNFLHPADERNHHLDRLEGCTVTLGFEHQEFLHHLKCSDGRHCTADGEYVSGYNWNATVWKIHRVQSKGKGSGKGKTRFMFAEEQGMGWLGVSAHDMEREGEVGLELFDFDDETREEEEGVVAFNVEVADDASYLRMTIPETGQQLRAMADATDDTTWFALESDLQRHFDMRMTVLCCHREGEWPLLLDDHESADIRFGSTGQIPFNSSRRSHLCQRAEQAVRHSSAPLANTQPPLRLSKSPNDWAIKDLPACWNDCSSPTICVQTGDCRCVTANSCPPRRDNPLLLLRKVAAAASGASSSPLGILKGYDPILAETVATLDFRDVLLPEARAAVAAHPEYLKVHVADGYEGQEQIESADCHNLQETHCFSADSIMYKALRHISVPAKEAEMVVLPVYQHCTGADFSLHDVMAFARQTIDGVESGDKPLSVIMTHDWGICIAFAW
ncbi:hypothetical protein BCR39DRAFT_531489 [Naematelia encephala]|uniref:NAD-dependent epimerase/dehydratase domain-containing protein n=1 Tax=Naematelia encephala TaxID=71784 RepID=A0A1Y2B4B9_9TREE|nr:hypothetical protein BCR39DRAFT_531489 [Naematelia encephala]